MMQNWKHELEELLYHLGIYLSQDGYPVIVRQQTWCSRSRAAAAADDGEFTWRWPSAAVAQRPAWNAASAPQSLLPGKPTRPSSRKWP